MIDQPSTSGSNGRVSNGRFGPGNKIAKGNPFARRVARLRSALYKSVSPDDLRQVVAALVKEAKGGDVPATRELLQRLLGPPEAVDLMERLDALEAKIEELNENRGQTWRR